MEQGLGVVLERIPQLVQRLEQWQPQHRHQTQGLELEQVPQLEQRLQSTRKANLHYGLVLVP
jgi:hypothetical protein